MLEVPKDLHLQAFASLSLRKLGGKSHISYTFQASNLKKSHLQRPGFIGPFQQNVAQKAG